jgi:membrane protein required for colicin V production
MNWLDIVLLVIIAASMLTSLRKGLSREIIGLVATILAIVLGIWFYGIAGAWFEPHLSSRAAAHFAGFVLVFVGVLLLGVAVSAAVGKFLKATGLSLFDHVLGAVFGLARGVLVAIALIMGIMAFSTTGNPPVSVVQSRTAPYVVDAARLIASMAPYELREGFRKSYAQVKSAWEKTLEDGIRKLPNAEKRQNERKI